MQMALNGLDEGSPQVQKLAAATAGTMADKGWARPGESSTYQPAGHHGRSFAPENLPDIAPGRRAVTSHDLGRMRKQGLRQILESGLDETGIHGVGDALDVLPVVGPAKALAQGDVTSAFERAIPGGGFVQKARSMGSEGVTTALGAVPGAKGAAMQASRAFMLAAQVPNDLVTGSIRTGAQAVSNIANNGFAGAMSNVGGNYDNPFDLMDKPGQPPGLISQSQGLTAARRLIQGKNIDVGKGWFPDPESETGKSAAAAARKAAPTIGGHAFTLGRFVANTITDPNSTTFDIISGGVDAYIATKWDPSNVPFNLWSEERRAGQKFAAGGLEEQALASKANARALQREAEAAKVEYQPGWEDAVAKADAARTQADEFSVSLRDKALEEAGAFKGHRNWASPKTAYQWFATKGKPVVDWSVKNTDPVESWKMWGGKGPREMHVELAAAENEGQAMEVLGRYLGTDVVGMPSTKPFRFGVRPLDNERWAAMAPTGARIGPEDPEASIEQMDRYLKNANLGPKARADALRPLFTAQTDDDYFDAVNKAMRHIEDHLVERYNMPRAAAHEATRWELIKNENLKMYAPDAATGGSIDIPFVQVGEDGVAPPGPMLPSELLSHGIPLPDFRVIRRATRAVGRDSYALRTMAQGAVDRALKSVEPDSPFFRTLQRLSDHPGFGVRSPHTGKEVVQSSRRGPILARDETKQLAQRLSEASDEASANGLDKTSRELRTASVMTRLSSGNDWAKAHMGGAIEGFGDLWRRSKLARPAWGLRVIGEEQARLWAYGMVGAFNHPIQAMAIAAGTNPDGKFAHALGNIADVFAHAPGGGRAAVALRPGLVQDVTGAQLGTAEELVDSLNGSAFSDLYGDQIHKGLRGPSVDMWGTARRGEANYDRGFSEDLVRLSQDPMARNLVGKTREEQRRWLTEDPAGKRLWEEKVARPGRKARATPEGEFKAIGDMTDTEKSQLVDFYLDSVNTRLEGFVAGSPEIRRAIESGTLGKASTRLDRNGQLDSRLEEEIARIRDGGWAGPEHVRVRDSLHTPNSASKLAAWGQTFDAVMWNLMPRPSNWLSRSPMFRQTYWQRVGELASGMDPKAKEKIISGAERAAHSAGWKLPDSVGALRRVEGVEGGLDVETVDRLAKAYALNTTKDVLYDLSERGQFFDALKAVLPFGEAWKEVLTRWGRAVWENPKVVHRLDQGIQSARESGIIGKDQYGKEAVVIPGTRWVTKQLLGAPVDIQQEVAGVNIAANGLPGFGPVVTIPLPYFAEKVGWNLDQPGVTRDIMGVVFPYGRTDSGAVDTDVINQLMPTFVARLSKVGKPDDPSVRSSVNYFMDYYASTGDYALHGEGGKDPTAEMNRMTDDAMSAAKNFQYVRAFGSAVLPSAPIPKYLFKDKNNKLAETQVVADQIQKRIDRLKKEGDPDAYGKSLDWFWKTFGTKNFLIPQGGSRANGLNLPRTQKQADFLIDRGYLRDEFGETYGLIIPPDPKGKQDITEYIAQLKRNERTAHTPKERLALANARVAGYIYDQAKSTMGTKVTDAQQAQLDDLDLILKKDYPGYKVHGFDYLQTPRRIDEITRMVNDPRVKSDPKTGPVAKAVRTYLMARAGVIEQQQTDAYGSTAKSSVSTSAKTKPLRDQLRELGDLILTEHPRFGAFWDMVLRREIQEKS